MIGNVFAVLLVLVTVAVHVPAEAQPAGKASRVGLLTPLAAPGPGQASPLLDALTDGLRALGYVEGRNLLLERRYAETHPERLPELAAELVRARVDLLVTAGSQASRAAKAATSSVPIVMVGVADPVEIGLVANLACPGGNVTGLAFNTGQQIYAKHPTKIGSSPSACRPAAAFWLSPTSTVTIQSRSSAHGQRHQVKGRSMKKASLDFHGPELT